MSYKKANSYLTSLIHHHGDSSDEGHKKLITAAKEDLIKSAKTEREIKAAGSKLRVTEKKAAANTFEGRAVKKVVDSLDKSSLGNHILGWFSPKRAR
jgi:hypothetical protein